MQDALAFWQRSFSRKIAPDVFQKRYAYNIRHNYGKEGKRADYTPFSCRRIITGQAPAGVADHHGMCCVCVCVITMVCAVCSVCVWSPWYVLCMCMCDHHGMCCVCVCVITMVCAVYVYVCDHHGMCCVCVCVITMVCAVYVHVWSPWYVQCVCVCVCVWWREGGNTKEEKRDVT